VGSNLSSVNFDLLPFTFYNYAYLMLRRVTFSALTLAAALVVLFVSIYRATITRYNFAEPNNSATGTVFSTKIEYSLPYSGILPDHPLWFLKVLRDRSILFFTTDSHRHAEKTLFLADSRLVMARSLQRKGNYENAVSTALKAENYLAEAFSWGKHAEVQGYELGGFYETIAKSSLVHREVLEKMMQDLPEEARPIVNKAIGQTIRIYEESVLMLREKGKDVSEL